MLVEYYLWSWTGCGRPLGPKTKTACVNVYQGNLTRIIQGTLYCLGYDPDGFDGVFGDACSATVKVFQSVNNLNADGVVGKDTWTTMLS